jgi:hypothetical protein
VGSTLVSKGAGWDDLSQCNHPLWKFGKECPDAVMRRVRRAAQVISDARIQCLSDNICYKCPNDCRISNRMVRKYNMEDTVLGGSGYTCRLHSCICQTECNYPKTYCQRCGDICALCNYGCTCPPGTPWFLVRSIVHNIMNIHLYNYKILN